MSLSTSMIITTIKNNILSNDNDHIRALCIHKIRSMIKTKNNDNLYRRSHWQSKLNEDPWKSMILWESFNKRLSRNKQSPRVGNTWAYRATLILPSAESRFLFIRSFSLSLWLIGIRFPFLYKSLFLFLLYIVSHSSIVQIFSFFLRYLVHKTFDIIYTCLRRILLLARHLHFI